MSFLISNAYAADAAAAPEASPYMMPIMLVVFALFFYFMILRPQQKRAKEHRKLMESISKGEEVLTNGGLIGRVVKLNEEYVTLALNENNEIMLKRNYIAAVLPKGTMKQFNS